MLVTKRRSRGTLGTSPEMFLSVHSSQDAWQPEPERMRGRAYTGQLLKDPHAQPFSGGGTLAFLLPSETQAASGFSHPCVLWPFLRWTVDRLTLFGSSSLGSQVLWKNIELVMQMWM